jgi:hypothetical protein
MSTSVGDSAEYDSVAMSKSSSSESYATAATAATAASLVDDRTQINEIEGLEIHPFVGVENIRNIVWSWYNKLNAGTSTDQFIAFNHVTESNLATIDAKRGRIRKFIRLTHYFDTSILIIRVIPSGTHEEAHANPAKNPF